MRSQLMIALAVILSLGAVAQDTPDPNWPDGYKLVCLLEAGAEVSASADGRVAMRRTAGAATTLALPDGGNYAASADADAIEVSVAGLRQDAAYVLGFEWWDADARGRRQSVALRPAGGEWVEVLPPTVPAAFLVDQPTFARVLLPLASEANDVSLRFKNEGGSDAVVGKVWLLERTGPPREKRVLVVTGDDHRAHRWRETAPEFAAILRADPRLEVSITESPAMLGSPLLDHYDAVLLHFKNYDERMPLGEAVRDGLRRYLAAGGGLVVAHFGCGAFHEWDGFAGIVGRVWSPALPAHDRYGPFAVRITDGEHPVTLGMDAFQTEDELYTCLVGDTPIRVLCDAVSNVDGKAHPMALLPENGKGRVLLCTFGHDVNSLQAEGTRALYRRAVAWAAGLKPN